MRSSRLLANLTVIPAVALLFCTNNKSLSVNQAQVKDSGFAVIELFTSEGCSSCPPADKAVAELQQRHPDDVYVLAFHVDYWNRLGWTDAYSQPAFTQRQNAYAARFRLQSIYTPQVVVNGQYEFVGSDKAKLESVTTTELKKPSSVTFQLTASLKDANTVRVDYTCEAEPSRTLQIAVVQNKITTDVKRGENGGKMLQHINVVRDHKTLPAASAKGSAELRLPSGLAAADVTIVAYLQDGVGKIIAANRTVVSGH